MDNTHPQATQQLKPIMPTTPATPAMNETVIPLTMTIGQVNAVLAVLHTGPFQQVKPLIELIMTQAQQHVAQLNSQPSAQPLQQLQSQQQIQQIPMQSNSERS